VVINISKEDIKLFEKLNIISQITPIKEKIKYFEQKYKHSFEAFEIYAKSEENFQEWDDYIEWKGYEEKLKDLELKLKEIESATDFKVS
jgi:hypothetical protein